MKNTEDLMWYVMSDEEVEASEANSYQIAVIVAATLEFIRNHPERLNETDHIGAITGMICDSLNMTNGKKGRESDPKRLGRQNNRQRF